MGGVEPEVVHSTAPTVLGGRPGPQDLRRPG
jgi:hypothetical protein